MEKEHTTKVFVVSTKIFVDQKDFAPERFVQRVSPESAELRPGGTDEGVRRYVDIWCSPPLGKYVYNRVKYCSSHFPVKVLNHRSPLPCVTP